MGSRGLLVVVLSVAGTGCAASRHADRSSTLVSVSGGRDYVKVVEIPPGEGCLMGRVTDVDPNRQIGERVQVTHWR